MIPNDKISIITNGGRSNSNSNSAIVEPNEATAGTAIKKIKAKFERSISASYSPSESSSNIKEKLERPVSSSFLRIYDPASVTSSSD